MSKATEPAIHEAHHPTLRRTVNVMNFSQMGLFVLALIYTLYFVRPVLLPIILALLLTLMLTPVHARLCKLLRLPSPLAALVVLSAFFLLLGGGLYYLSAPAANYVSKLKDGVVQDRLRQVFAPISDINKEIEDVAKQVEEFTEENSAVGPGQGAEADATEIEADAKMVEIDVSPAGEPQPLSVGAEDSAAVVSSVAAPVTVEIRENRVDVIYEAAQDFALHFGLTVTMSFFFLAFGQEMLRRLSENKMAEELVGKIYSDVSRYLLTITLINICLGVAVGLAMLLLGMPNPLLWGAMAALLNYIPYIGALIGTATVGVVAAITFSNPAGIALVPIVYYLLTAVEGNFITPAIIGGKFTINPIVVFLWVVAWGALWGIPGMLIGLPLLMMFRIIVGSVPALAGLERVMSTAEA